jgi:RES domain-containing protein
VRHIRRGGVYFRVGDPHWKNPLDGSHAAESGGRWNPPNSFPVVYLNGDVRVARANVARKFRGRPYGPELLEPREAPVLVQTTVSEADYLDIITDEGCVAAGLPKEYPNEPGGGVVAWERCQRIGVEAWDSGDPGVACRSAAPNAPADGEELAWFARAGTPPLKVDRVLAFDQWFW